MTNDQPDLAEMPEAKKRALNALRTIADRSPAERRISATTLRKIIDVAWKHQFDAEVERTAARRELREVLSPEFERVRRANDEAK